MSPDLPQRLPAPDFLTFTYRPDLDVVLVRWLRQPTPDELHQGYLALLEAAVTVSCPYWLLDVRGRDDSNKQHTQWMLDMFFPLLPQRFAGRVCLAYLFAPSHLRELEAASEVAPLAYFDGKPYCVARFIEEAAALAWLQKQEKQG